jgi:head-tail adaptor
MTTGIPLSGAELTWMRDEVEELIMTDTCTIQTVSRASDGMGGFTETWANTYQNVPCRLSPQGGSGRVQGDQFTVVTGWVLDVAYDQAIAAGNRVVLGGDTFDVLEVRDDHTDRILRRAAIKRLD